MLLCARTNTTDYTILHIIADQYINHTHTHTHTTTTTTTTTKEKGLLKNKGLGCERLFTLRTGGEGGERERERYVCMFGPLIVVEQYGGGGKILSSEKINRFS